MSVPVFLHGYEPFESLEAWRVGEDGREWAIRTRRKSFECELKWDYPLDKGQSCRLVHASDSLQESVYAALETFRLQQRKTTKE